MRVRFLADANLDARIVRGLKRRLPEIDFQTATQAGIADLPDPTVLRIAAETNRVLVTHDRRTMPRHFIEFLTHQKSAGVIVIPKPLPIGVVVEELILIWSATEAEEWSNRLMWLPV